MVGEVWAQVEMTKEQAVEFSFVLDDLQRILVSQIETIQRKRTWRPSEKAMAIAEKQRQLNRVTALNNSIQRAAKIRGY